MAFQLAILAERIEAINMNLKKFGISVVIVCVLLLIISMLFDASNAISQSEAVNIAKQELNSFAKERNVSVNDFEKEEIRWNGNQWEIYYKGSNSNNLLVNILVSKTGRSEVHSTTK
jgi:uncharacterized protein (UPF0333 family)